MFYAVAIPTSYEGNECSNPADLVFDNLSSALHFSKTIKTSRFNSFSSYDEALEYASRRVPDIPEVKSLSADAEKQSVGNFKTPIPRELVALRRAIERGSFEDFQSIITANPKFLISSADSAVMLMEGPRYNAAHIAAKADKTNILKKLLETVSDHSYVKQLYPADNPAITEERVKVLLDCYLNTPDKGACETPLHFASKFGSVGCVELLLSYPECDIDKVNKQDKKASEAMCERKGDEGLKTQISCLFNNQYYVQMRRDDENIFIEKPSRGLTPSKNVSAIAGPTSPEVAESIYKYLKSPARKENPQSLIRLKDSIKGLERDASLKCKELSVKWSEYWPFLDSHVDLCSDEGLQVLEDHFRKVYDNIQNEKTQRVLDESLSPLSSICNHLENLKLNSSFIDEDYPSTNGNTLEGLAVEIGDDEEIEDDFFTAPSSPTFEHCFYVYGLSQTKWDVKALHAMLPLRPIYGKHPLTYNWMKRVSSNCDNLNLTNPKNFENLQKQLFT